MAPKQANRQIKSWRIAAQCTLIGLSFLPIWLMRPAVEARAKTPVPIENTEQYPVSPAFPIP
ncbi:MAG: hypothetical protein H6566_07650 [Lewinellaceae bacterium]|nr:hypothetical protein [Lewinellaceae bacterium]